MYTYNTCSLNRLIRSLIEVVMAIDMSQGYEWVFNIKSILIQYWLTHLLLERTHSLTDMQIIVKRNLRSSTSFK